MKSKDYVIWCFFVIFSLRSILSQYSYPAQKSISRYAATVFRDKKAGGITIGVETHANYKQCITACYKKGLLCKSIDAEIIDNSTLKCRFFNVDSPSVQFAEGFLFISTKPPNCSLSCSLTLNPCGKCECNPSCAGKNRRQYICNCKEAAGIKANCKEHYNNGFTKSGVYQISPKNSAFDTVCEMEKFERQNPEVTNPICYSLQPNSKLSYNNSVSYCVFGSLWNGCKLSDSNLRTHYDNYANIGSYPNSWSSCIRFCVDYQQNNPTQKGYVASFIAGFDGGCQCLYGFSGQTTSFTSACSFFETIPPTALPKVKDIVDQELIKDKLYGTLSLLEKTYSVSFKIKPISFSKGWKNVIHLTIGENMNQYGDRCPGVSFHDDGLGSLYIASAVNGDINYFFITKPLVLYQWSSIKISQFRANENYMYTIYLNELLVHSVVNTKPQSFSNVKVYTSSPWYESQGGSIKDLKIISEKRDSYRGKCADGWLFYEDYCYFINSVTLKNRLDSSILCQNYGGNLLSIADEAENLFILNQLQDYKANFFQRFWIGLIRSPLNSSIFEWSDNTSTLFYNWDQNQPDNAGNIESCGDITYAGWNDNNCNHQLGFICKNKTDIVDQELIKDKLHETLSLLEKTYSVSFKIKPRSYSKGWKNVIHLTVGQNMNQYGDRCPAVWFHDDGSGSLVISSAINGNMNYVFNTQPLPLYQWSSIKISQFRTNGIYMYTIYLNELLVHSVVNTKPQSFSNVKVYTSNPWHEPQDGSIKDLKIISEKRGVWTPMMTRFADWETGFWNRSYEDYENGFGLVNQQWIGLKKIYQITNTFLTDMRVDYFFEESITYSTMYYNVTVGSSEDEYVLSYEKYDSRGSLEPDRLNASGTTFKNSSKWWTHDCNECMYPTSSNFISYGSTENLVSIQFFLQTNDRK